MKKMNVKKLLIPKRIEYCTQCPQCISVTPFESDMTIYFCGLCAAVNHSDEFIPDNCPLEDWK